MPLGDLFSCVWLVLLALNLMTTFPHCIYCSSYSTSTYLSSSSSSHSSSLSQSSQPEQNSATAAISAHTPCHHNLITSELISANCQQTLQNQQQPRMRITGEISEGPGPPSCPVSCSDQRNDIDKTSCKRYLKENDCDNSWSSKDWSSVRLQHCCEHSVPEAVLNGNESLLDRQQCERHVRDLLELDAFVAKVTCQFEQILRRYDCNQNYSVNNCQRCKDAYRRWVCASLIPHWRERHKIKPCRSICHAVEQNCPWFLPADKNPGYPAQYAGEPLFQCIDENIPETGEQLLRSTYGSGCCYDYCEKPVENKRKPNGYHHENQRYHYEIGSCVQGCDDSSSDPSHETKNGQSSPCQTPSSTASTTTSNTPATSSKNQPTIPFVNFPLSSCPSSATSSSSKDADSKSPTHKNAPSNLLILSLILVCLYAKNLKIDDWR